LASTAKGELRFAAQDVRRLDYGDQEFDIVYSMSVIEHVEGQSGDSEAIREMVRVLRPGGLLLASVPFSSTYIEQHREGFAGCGFAKQAMRRGIFFSEFMTGQR